MDNPHRNSGADAIRERIERLREDLTTLSSAIREELDWRDKLYPIAEDEDESEVP